MGPSSKGASGQIVGIGRMAWERLALALNLSNLAGNGERQSLNALAADTGVSPYELVVAAKQGRTGVRELNAVLSALGLDGDAVRQSKAPTFTEMQFACTVCDLKRECRKAIRSKTIGSDLERICASADPIRVAAR